MKVSARHLFTHGDFSAWFLANEIAPMVIIRTSVIGADWKKSTTHAVYEIPDERAAWAAAEAACAQHESDQRLALFPIADIPPKSGRPRKAPDVRA